jgi:hypothetical protein
MGNYARSGPPYPLDVEGLGFISLEMNMRLIVSQISLEICVHVMWLDATHITTTLEAPLEGNVIRLDDLIIPVLA